MNIQGGCLVECKQRSGNRRKRRSRCANMPILDVEFTPYVKEAIMLQLQWVYTMVNAKFFSSGHLMFTEIPLWSHSVIVRRCSARNYGCRRNVRISFISTRLFPVNYKLSILMTCYNAGVIARTLNKPGTTRNSYN